MRTKSADVDLSGRMHGINVNSNPGVPAISTTCSMGWMAPVSLLACITETSAVSGRIAAAT